MKRSQAIPYSLVVLSIQRSIHNNHLYFSSYDTTCQNPPLSNDTSRLFFSITLYMITKIRERLHIYYLQYYLCSNLLFEAFTKLTIFVGHRRVQEGKLFNSPYFCPSRYRRFYFRDWIRPIFTRNSWKESCKKRGKEGP